MAQACSVRHASLSSQMAHITVRGPLPTSPEETVPCDAVRFSQQPFTVSADTPRRPLRQDVATLLFKAYSRFRMAVRQSDGFVAEVDVPPVTVHSVKDSEGVSWSASVTYDSSGGTYTNWCGEVFKIVFEDRSRNQFMY